VQIECHCAAPLKVGIAGKDREFPRGGVQIDAQNSKPTGRDQGVAKADTGWVSGASALELKVA
jgi:hypothetical protein